MKYAIIALVVLVVLIAVYIASTYNSFVKGKN